MARPADVKVTLRVPIYQIAGAARAFDYAYHNSDFSGGWALVQCGLDSFAVKKNPAGYTVWLNNSDAPQPTDTRGAG